MPDAPLLNDPASRSPDGTILDQSQPQTSSPAPNPTGQATRTPPPNSGTEASSTTETPTNATASAPATYTAFRAPDGVTLSTAAIESATPVFRELGLSQDQAQKLVDLYATQQSAGDKALADKYAKAVEDQKSAWYNEVMRDPAIGPKIDSVKADIGRMFDAMGDTKLVSDLRGELERTGMANNPTLVRAFAKLASHFTEGTHVTGDNPSPLGVARPNGASRPSIASAMFPNLPSSS